MHGHRKKRIRKEKAVFFGITFRAEIFTDADLEITIVVLLCLIFETHLRLGSSDRPKTDVYSYSCC